MADVLHQVWGSEAVEVEKELGRWYHNSDLTSLFRAVAMESLLIALIL